jgi:hypothetical protein
MKGPLAVTTLLMAASMACAPADRIGSPPEVSASHVVSREPAGRGGSASKTRCSGRTSRSFDGTQMAVRVRVRPCTVSLGEAPTALLKNVGEGELGYGFGFKLERKTTEGWRWVNRRQAFRLPLFHLPPGVRSDPESLAVYYDEPTPIELPAGWYRVTKTVTLAPGEPRPPVMGVRVTFRVTP